MRPHNNSTYADCKVRQKWTTFWIDTPNEPKSLLDRHQQYDWGIQAHWSITCYPALVFTPPSGTSSLGEKNNKKRMRDTDTVQLYNTEHRPRHRLTPGKYGFNLADVGLYVIDLTRQDKSRESRVLIGYAVTSKPWGVWKTMTSDDEYEMKNG